MAFIPLISSEPRLGETETLKDSVSPNHEKWGDALHQGMNYVSVYVPFPVESRHHIERELIQHFNPPLNDRLV